MWLKIWDSETHYDCYYMSVSSVEEAKEYFNNFYKIEKI